MNLWLELYQRSFPQKGNTKRLNPAVNKVAVLTKNLRNRETNDERKPF